MDNKAIYVDVKWDNFFVEKMFEKQTIKIPKKIFLYKLQESSKSSKYFLLN